MLERAGGGGGGVVGRGGGGVWGGCFSSVTLARSPESDYRRELFQQPSLRRPPRQREI